MHRETCIKPSIRTEQSRVESFFEEKELLDLFATEVIMEQNRNRERGQTNITKNRTW